MRIIPLLLICSLLCAGCADPHREGAGAEFAVAPEGVSSLEGEWRAMKGDSPRYALPDFDDSSWPLVRVPGNLMDRYPGYRGIAWYRARITMPWGGDDGRYLLQLGRISDADELFVNGVPVGRTGDAGGARSHGFDRTRGYLIPCGLLRAGEGNLLAVRVRGYLSDSLGMIWGEYLMGPHDAMRRLVFRGYAVDVLFIGIYLFIAVYFFIFSLMGRVVVPLQRYLAAFSTGLAVYIFCQSQIKYLFTDHFYFFHYVQYMVGIAGTCVFLLLFRSIFNSPVTRVDRGAMAALAVAAAAVTILPEIRDWTIPRLLWHAVVVYIAVIGVIHTVRSVLDRDWSRLYVYVGFSMILACVVMEIFRANSVVPDFDYLKFGLIGMIVMISFFIARQLSSIQRMEESILLKLDREVQERNRELVQRNRTIEDQLQIARLIYDKLMPAGPPSLRGIDFSAACVPIDTVGGDFYDYRDRGDSVTVFVGDVTGHGVPGAFLSLIAKITFQHVQEETREIPETLAAMNRVLCDSAVLSNFMTGILCTIDVPGKRLLYSSAGHPPCLLMRRGEGSCIPLLTKSIPLGLRRDQRFRQSETGLGSGDRLVLYTDGIIEAANERGELFGEERFAEVLGECRSLKAAECVQEVLRRITDYGDGHIDDDITLVVIDVQ
ncbi:MAG: SpoIIE family protein phosphatase [Spirochaetes bacterium]|nr:SpoIIE family protein phosphatase [Spirochaetota bacterium]